jgi:hypothetical protein
MNYLKFKVSRFLSPSVTSVYKKTQEKLEKHAIQQKFIQMNAPSQCRFGGMIPPSRD